MLTAAAPTAPIIAFVPGYILAGPPRPPVAPAPLPPAPEFPFGDPLPDPPFGAATPLDPTNPFAPVAPTEPEPAFPL